jgi:hypothetical protein
MMGVKTPETCWAVNKRQDYKLEKLLHLVGLFIWIVWWCTDLQILKLLDTFVTRTTLPKYVWYNLIKNGISRRGRYFLPTRKDTGLYYELLPILCLLLIAY